jgi:hypothetical protein
MAVMRTYGAVPLAYAVACLSVSVMYHGLRQGGVPDAMAFLADVGSGTVIAAIFSLPGFVVLRLALWSGGVRGLAWFAAAGAANGLIALSFFFQRPTWDGNFAVMGLVAGAVYWWIDRTVAGRTLARDRSAGAV